MGNRVDEPLTRDRATSILLISSLRVPSFSILCFSLVPIFAMAEQVTLKYLPMSAPATGVCFRARYSA